MQNKSTPSDDTEDRMSATGSNVAPRSIGRQFSPIEKTTKAHWRIKREIYPCGDMFGNECKQFTWE